MLIAKIGTVEQQVLSEGAEIPHGSVKPLTSRPSNPNGYQIDESGNWVQVGYDTFLHDRLRLRAYKDEVDPLIAEMQVKDLLGDTTEVERLKTLILTKRTEIQKKYPK